MGVQTPSKLFYLSYPLKWEHVLHLVFELKRLKSSSTITGGETVPKPTIDIDASLIAYKSKGKSFSAEEYVLKCANSAACSGIEVSVIADGEKRHSSKRATFSRRFKHEENRLKAIMLERELTSKIQERADSTTLEKISKDLKSCQNSINNILSDDFLDNLKQAISDSAHHANINLIQSGDYQADPIMSRRSINNVTEIIWSSDSDLLVQSPKAILIKDFTFSASKTVPQNLVLWTGDALTAIKVSDILASRFPDINLNMPEDDDKDMAGIFKRPDHPVFENEPDFFCRALYAVAIGNDYWEGGQKNCGPKRVMDFKIEARDISDTSKRRDFLRDKIAAFTTGSIHCKETIETFAKAVAYEPSHIHGKEKDFIHEKPTNLPFYLRDYAPEGCTVAGENVQPKVLKCAHLCTNESHHEFLETEILPNNSEKCSLCSATICMKCRIHNSSNGCICIGCHRLSVGSNEKRIPDVKTMKEELTHIGVEIPATATFLEIFELHENLVLDKGIDLFEEDIKNVKYPCLPVSTLSTPNSEIKVLAKTKVRDIGHIIRGSSLPPEKIVEVIKLLGFMVSYDNSSNNNNNNNNSGCVDEIFKIMPKIMKTFACGSRVHTGMRLLKRAARHGTYVHEPDVRDAELTIAEYNDKLCFILDKDICASYHDKKDTKKYRTSTCWTCDDLLCCKCNCDIGARIEGACNVGGRTNISSSGTLADRHACVHSLSIMYSLILELHKGLAEHCLVELNVKAKECSAIADDMSLMEPINSLISATGNTETTNGNNVLDKLSAYNVGTENWKTAPEPPKPDMVRPLRECNNTPSPNKKVKNIIRVGRDSSRPNVASQSNDKNKTPVDDDLNMVYINSKLCIDALLTILHEKNIKNLLSKNKKDPIAFKLLNYRYLEALMFHADTDINPTAIRLEYEGRWRTILEDKCVNKRTYNSKILGNKRALETNKSNGESNDDTLRPRKRLRKACWMINCCNEPPLSLRCVPRLPPRPDSEASPTKQTTWQKKRTKRNEFTDRLGLGRNCDPEDDIRFCKSHPVENVTIKVPIQIRDKDGNVTSSSTEKMDLENVPVANGNMSFHTPAMTDSKGLAGDRWDLLQLQMFECMEIESGKKDVSNMNPTVVKTAGLDVHDFNTKQQEPDTTNKAGEPEAAKYNLQSLSASEVHRLTGFSDLSQLLSYVIVVCRGDLELLTETCSKLTFLEEWIIFLEFQYGRTHRRLVDLEKNWNIRTKTLRNLIKSKSKICLDARRIWPSYVSLEEDEKFRKDTWKDFKGKRIIMHDMSNIPINAPSDAELNRATFNPYYGMPCGKGGIFTQLCGWQGTLEVYTGGIGDSDYVRRSGLLAEQSKFTKEEAMKNKCREVPFINTFDKGYRVILDCLNEGGQLCWQPCFKKSDERYGTYATLKTAAVAYTRSANERSVLQVKHSWLVKDGAKGRTIFSLDLLCDAWLIQGFQTNFMYNSVL